MLLKLLKARCYLWLPGYLANRIHCRGTRIPKDKDIHVLLMVVDHFEPSRKEGRLGVEKVRQWCEKYASVARLHRDSDGDVPQHTWFYRYDYPNYDCINILSEYSYRGFGEIEFHLHHGYDTPESFEEKLIQGVKWFNKAGAMISFQNPSRMHFGYIAGNWALDNGRRDPALSGVNTEIGILSKAGCYGDFTFPAIGTNAQPRKVNSIYYAKDSTSAKSYSKGTDVRVGGDTSGDLMIFQGPVYVDWKRKYTESAALESFAPFYPARMENWIRAGIHVIGRPEWVFIKLHTHGMQSGDYILGRQLDGMFSEVERRFKEPPYYLHYITAREGYNIVKAAEAGLEGNPHDFRDFSIPQPANRNLFCNRPYILKKYSKDHIIISLENALDDSIISFKESRVKSITGAGIQRIEVVFSGGGIQYFEVNGEGKCEIVYREGEKEKNTRGMERVSLPFLEG